MSRRSESRPISVDRLRIRAGIIDFVGVALVAYFIGDELIRGLASQADVYKVVGIVIAMNVLYHGVMELAFGRSLGKRWTGLVIVSVSGGWPSNSQLIVRNLARVIDILPNLYILGLVVIRANNERSQRVGDLLAGTMVIPSRPPT